MDKQVLKDFDVPIIPIGWLAGIDCKHDLKAWAVRCFSWTLMIQCLPFIAFMLGGRKPFSTSFKGEMPVALCEAGVSGKELFKLLIGHISLITPIRAFSGVILIPRRLMLTHRPGVAAMLADPFVAA